MGGEADRPLALLVGDVDHAEFAEPLNWLRGHALVRGAAECDAAARMLSSGRPLPQVIVLAQPRPGRFTAEDVERLHRLAPMARLIALLGSCCEGELRTGTPWPGVVRVYWHQFVGRARSEWPWACPGGDSMWALPRTATGADQTLLASTRGLPRLAGLVAISSPGLADFEALSDVCRQAGAATVWLAPGRLTHCGRTDVLVWDEDGRSMADQAALRAVRDQLRPSRTLVLAGFPRHGDVEAFHAAGADEVLSKPLLLDDLLNLLAAWIPAEAAESPTHAHFGQYDV